MIPEARGVERRAEKNVNKWIVSMNAVLLLCGGGAQAASSEGRVADMKPLPVDSARVAKYEGRSNPSADTKSQAKSPGVLHAQKPAGTRSLQKEVRPASLKQSQKASYFYFYDAHSSLHTDRDTDGYYSEFSVRFDADTTLGDELVYAKLYLRRVGESDWTLYHATDDFWINGESNDDDFFVRTSLDDGFATGEYDVLIDLYDATYDEVVATIDYTDAGELGLLPLEEAGLDVPVEETGFSIGDVQTTLLADNDQDGYYSRFAIAFDPDADMQAGYLYARVWIRPQGGEWIEEHVSENFPVDAAGENDVYSFTAEWASGYPTAYYDVQIDLYDASTDLLVASAGSERLELSRIPLEDGNRDQKISAPVSNGGGSVTSHEHGGGGAFEAAWLAMFAFLLCARRALAGRVRARVD
jgi:hypothetical protein